jgi:hypothetical protein
LALGPVAPVSSSARPGRSNAMTIVWILVVVILVLLVIALARRVL